MRTFNKITGFPLGKRLGVLIVCGMLIWVFNSATSHKSASNHVTTPQTSRQLYHQPATDMQPPPLGQVSIQNDLLPLKSQISGTQLTTTKFVSTIATAQTISSTTTQVASTEPPHPSTQSSQPTEMTQTSSESQSKSSSDTNTQSNSTPPQTPDQTCPLDPILCLLLYSSKFKLAK